MRPKIMPRFLNAQKEAPDLNEEIEFDQLDLMHILSNIQPVHINDNKEKVHRKGLTLNECDVPGFLELKIHEISSRIKENNFQVVIPLLKQCDMVLSQAKEVSWKHFSLVKINLEGICFYKIGFLEESYILFDQTLKNFKKAKRCVHQLKEQILIKRIELQCQLQQCILLSEMGKHVEALDAGKVGLKKAIKLFSQTFCFISHSLKLSFDQGMDYLLNRFFADQMKQQHQYLKKLVPVYCEIMNHLITIPKPIMKSSTQGKIEQTFRNLQEAGKGELNLDVLFSGWSGEKMTRSNILFFLQLKFLFYEQLFLETDELYVMEFSAIFKVVEPETIIENISLLTVSLYCISTEARFNEEEQNNQMSQSENFLSRALEIAYLFLPHEMPIVGQIISVHNKFHGVNKQVIYEDRENQQQKVQDDVNVVVLKPLKGQTKGTFFVPIIRKQKSSDTKQNKLLRDRNQPIKYSNEKPIREIQTEIDNVPVQDKLQFDQWWSQKKESIQSSRSKSAEKKVGRGQQMSSKLQINPQFKQLQAIYQTLQKATLTPKTAEKGLRDIRTLNNTVTTQQEIMQNRTLDMGLASIEFESSKKKNNVQFQQNFFSEKPPKKLNIQINNNINVLIASNNSNLEEPIQQKPSYRNQPRFLPKNLQQLAQTSLKQKQPLNIKIRSLSHRQDAQNQNYNRRLDLSLLEVKQIQ